MAERLKNLLLGVLLLLMCALLAATFFVGIQGSRGGQRLLQSLEDQDHFALSETVRPAAQPEKLALIHEAGVFLAQDSSNYGLLYQQAEPLWQEALGSAATLQPMEETAYLEQLQAPAMLLQYHAPQPLYLMRAWSGSESLREELEVTAVTLTLREERVILMITDRNGGRWQAETAASPEELESLCTAWPENNSVLAGRHALLAGDEVLSCQVNRAFVWQSNAPELVRKGELSQSIQALFGMNAYLTKVYPNADGSLVYVESHSTIQLSPAGDLSYSGEGVEMELTSGDQRARQVEICQQVHERLSHLWEQAGASGKLSPEEMTFTGEQSILRFGLHLNGQFVEREEGYWATVTVTGDRITAVSAALRQLEEVEQVQMLPLYHAAATIRQERGSLRVRLLEEADGRMIPQICYVTEE